MVKFSVSSRGEVPPLLPLEKCVAKSSEDGRTMSVADHLRLVGMVAREIFHRLPGSVKTLLPQGVVSLAALHDVGKVSPGFQKKVQPQAFPNSSGWVEKHAEIGEASLYAYYGGTALQAGPCPADWAQVVGLHHGCREKAPGLDNDDRYGGPSWAKARRELIEQLLKELGPLPTDAPQDFQIPLVAGFTCIADWIASDETHFPLGQPLPFPERLQEGVKKVLDEIGWFWPPVRSGKTFEELFGFAPNEIQRAAYELASEPGLFVIEAPMGLGKTEAALWAAYRLLEQGHNHGLYFALPTRLTSNALYPRIEEFLSRAFGGQAAARLIHSFAWLAELLAGGEELRPGGNWFAPSKRALLWPFGVGTIDQALLGVVNVRHYFLRLFGLAGKVVILDEVHSYDIFTGTLLARLVDLLRQLRCTVIVLSATLTKQRRRALGGLETPEQDDAYPLLTHTASGHRRIPPSPSLRKTVSLRLVSEEEPSFWDELRGRLAQGQSILAVMNTVSEAQKFYRMAKAQLASGEGVLGLLHSAFLPWQRQEAEGKWVQRLGKHGDRPPSLLVGTQVLEQSLDIDSDLLITALAPTDFLFQRLGRLWRHPRKQRPADRPECWLLDRRWLQADAKEEFLRRIGPTRCVYAPYVLWRTLQVFRGRDQLLLPDEVRPLLEQTYLDPQPGDPSWVHDLFQQMKKEQEKMQGMALAVQNFTLPGSKDLEAKTRYNDLPRTPALLVTSFEWNGSAWQVSLPCGVRIALGPQALPREKIARLYLNLLDVRGDWLTSLPRESRGLPDPLDRILGKDIIMFYFDEKGRLLDRQKKETGLFYTRELGLYREEVSSTTQAWEADNELQFDW